MRKHVLLYGLLAGALIALLRFVEYRWLIIGHSLEIYGGIVAVIFASVGLWLGRRLTRPKVTVVERVVERVIETVVTLETRVPSPDTFQRDDDRLGTLAITPRELEVLSLMAEGLSNREIAARAGVSENTVKTHSSRVFEKLGAKRRTQAVQMGKQLRLIP